MGTTLPRLVWDCNPDEGAFPELDLVLDRIWRWSTIKSELSTGNLLGREHILTILNYSYKSKLTNKVLLASLVTMVTIKYSLTSLYSGEMKDQCGCSFV